MTAPCDRFEREALLDIERGAPLDPHFATCADCRAAAERHRALAEDLRSLVGGEEPPAGWRDAVWERAAAGPARRRSHGWTWAAGLAAAAAVAVVLLPRPAARPVSLAVDVLAGPAAARRTDTTAVGSRLALRIPLRGEGRAELRVYRNDTDLVLRCADQPPCRRSGRDLVAEVTLDAIGRYQPVAVVFTREVPAPGRGLDRDSADAMESGAAVYLGREVTVE
jgi:hypothetical protein